MKKLIYTLLFFILLSCGKSNSLDNGCKEYRFTHFKMCIPNIWKKIKIMTYDSSGVLFINKNDSIFISDSDIEISDNPILVNTENEKKDLLDFSNNEVHSEDIHIYKNRDFDISNAVYKKNYYYYDKINNIEVLVVFPKNKSGTIGAFFNKNSTQNKLTIYCNNPSENTKEELKKVFNSVKVFD